MSYLQYRSSPVYRVSTHDKGASMFRRMVDFIVTRPLVQWIWVNLLPFWSGGWAIMSKNDRRFLSPLLEKNMVNYAAAKVPPTKLTTRRRTWHTWIVLQLPEESSASYLAIDVHTGRRLACLGHLVQPGERIAFRVGGEPAVAMFIVRNTGNSSCRTSIAIFVERLPEDELKAKYPEVRRV